MKRLFYVIVVTLLFASCKKDNPAHYSETITSGSKWGLQIGSSFSDLYTQLQQMGIQKHFNEVEGFSNMTFASPAALPGNVTLYSGFTLESDYDPMERVIFRFVQDTVSSISEGKALPEEITSWPADAQDDIAIHVSEHLGGINDKLVVIYQKTTHNNYSIRIANKRLDLGYDPAMAGADKWYINFDTAVRPGVNGRSFVTLSFTNGRLSSIRHDYDESVVYND